MISKFTLLTHNYQYVSCFFTAYFKKVDIMLVTLALEPNPMLIFYNL